MHFKSDFGPTLLPVMQHPHQDSSLLAEATGHRSLESDRESRYDRSESTTQDDELHPLLHNEKFKSPYNKFMGELGSNRARIAELSRVPETKRHRDLNLAKEIEYLKWANLRREDWIRKLKIGQYPVRCPDSDSSSDSEPVYVPPPEAPWEKCRRQKQAAKDRLGLLRMTQAIKIRNQRTQEAMARDPNWEKKEEERVRLIHNDYASGHFHVYDEWKETPAGVLREFSVWDADPRVPDPFAQNVIDAALSGSAPSTARSRSSQPRTTTVRSTVHASAHRSLSRPVIEPKVFRSASTFAATSQGPSATGATAADVIIIDSDSEGDEQNFSAGPHVSTTTTTATRVELGTDSMLSVPNQELRLTRSELDDLFETNRKVTEVRKRREKLLAEERQLELQLHLALEELSEDVTLSNTGSSQSSTSKFIHEEIERRLRIHNDYMDELREYEKALDAEETGQVSAPACIVAPEKEEAGASVTEPLHPVSEYSSTAAAVIKGAGLIGKNCEDFARMVAAKRGSQLVLAPIDNADHKRARLTPQSPRAAPSKDEVNLQQQALDTLLQYMREYPTE